MQSALPLDPDALERVLGSPPPFYRDRVRVAVGGDVRAALARLPLTRRAELLTDQLAHLPLGTRRVGAAGNPVRVGTAGSGEMLLVLAWSAADLARERAAGARLLGRVGIRPGMRVANTLAGALVTPGALLLGDVVEDIGALDVPLGTIDADAAARQGWELVLRVRPDVMVLEEATAARWFAAVPEGELAWWRGIVWLRRGSAGGAPAPPAGFTGWQRTWLAVPEATSFVAVTCGEGRFHTEDGVLAEVVDDASGRPADAGTLALTVPAGDAPLLRYATDIPARAVAACGCGAPGVPFVVG